MNICVYAICKNEEKFAARWAQNMSEADSIIVLDTKSTDKTVEILSSFPKVTVYSEAIIPWRFDTARNKSLEKVPADADYCVCTDLDEVFSTGWREKLEKALEKNPDIVSYRYTWDFSPDGKENTVFHIEKIHRRHGFIWTHPVHEVLKYIYPGNPQKIFADGIHLNHFPDKEKSRSSYLPLLEQSVKESPEDDRNMHYLGREYMFYQKYDKAINTLKKHLSMKSSTWKDERCASMRFIAHCYNAKGDFDNARNWYLKACLESPNTREPWVDAAVFMYTKKEWHWVISLISEALKIADFIPTYIADISNYREKPYDLLSLAFYNIGDMENALKNAETALSFAPENERIKNNILFFKNE